VVEYAPEEELPGLRAGKGKVGKDLALEGRGEGVEVDVPNAPVGAGQAGDDPLGQEGRVAPGHQGRVFREQRPGHEPVYYPAQGHQLWWGGLDEGEVVGQRVPEDLLGDVDPPDHAEAVLLPPRGDAP
jgi:hypothetical protein